MTAVATRHADNTVRPQQTAGLLIRSVLLADMHPVAVELGSEVGAIIHDEREVTRLGDRLQNAGSTPDRVVVRVLQA